MTAPRVELVDFNVRPIGGIQRARASLPTFEIAFDDVYINNRNSGLKVFYSTAHIVKMKVFENRRQPHSGLIRKSLPSGSVGPPLMKSIDYKPLCALRVE